MKRLLTLLVVFVLSGCASLPTGLEIEKGPQLLPAAEQDFSYYSPASPAPGASAQEVVSGFLAAGTGPQNDYAVAREYLTESFAARWRPDTQTLVRVGIPVYESSSETLQVVQINVGARVDDQGRYQSLDSEQVNLRFQLLEENGEWRIASAPNLTVVTLPVFSVVFNALPVYFLDSTSDQLVPDLRWFPTRTSTPTRLVNALLDGPTEWLGGFVSSAIPIGTGLTVNAVRIEGGVAQVDFDANALEADLRQRALMLAQLLSTLRQLPGVSSVALSVNGAIQEIQPAAISAGLTQSSTYALSNSAVIRLSGSEAGPIPTSSDWVAEISPRLLAVDYDGENLVLAGDDRMIWLTNTSIGTTERDLDLPADLRAIQFDRTSHLLAFPAAAEASVAVYDASGLRRELALELSGELIDAQLSPEGARLAVIVREEEQDRVHIFGVRRDSSGTPVLLSQGLSFAAVLGDALSLSWSDLTNLRVLERTSSGLTALSEYSITGPRKQLNLPPVVGVKLGAGSVLISSYLLTEAGEVWVLTTSTWRRIQTGAIDISTGR